MVTVVGAGFSGLTLAYELARRGVPVRLIERAPSVGGLISTRETPFGPAEMAAPSFNRTTRVDRFLTDLGLQAIEPSRESRKRFFFDGSLKKWPLGFSATTRLVSGYLWNRMSGQVHPRPGETLADWASRVLGEQASRKLVSTAFQGIYACPATELSAELIVGPMFAPRREPFRGVLGIEGGMGKLAAALVEKTLMLGGYIERDVGDFSLQRSSGTTVFCTPPPETAELLRASHPALAERIAQIRMLPLMSVTAFYDEINPVKGFGCLVAPDSGLRTMGVLLNHRIFPDRPGLPSETWIMGGTRFPEILSASDDDVAAVISQEREKIFGLTNQARHFEITRWERALPAYDVHLREILKGISAPRGVHFHGNWTGAIGLSKILRSSQELAGRISAEKS